MKGIAHFISGVAVASFCPWAVEAAQNGNPAYFILGAVTGILPDTVDFKFYRFFYKHDIRVEPWIRRPTPPGGHPSMKGIASSQCFSSEFPSRGGVAEGRGGLVLFDAEKLDPQPVADAVAQAVSLAMEGKRTTLKLASIKLGADDWRQYRVKIDPEAGEVQVQFGPIVSTGQVPQPNSMPDPRLIAIAKFDAPILQRYEPTYTVDIFDGPSFAFNKKEAPVKPISFTRRLLDICYWLLGKTDTKRNGSLADTNNQSPITNNCLSEKGAVEIDFLPWHRNWSHSLTVGALLAGIASFWTWKAGVVVFGAYVIHVIEDQLGHMGSNLFFPFTKKRVPGFKMMRSGDAFPNFAGIWLCCLLIFWNLYAGIENPLYHFGFIRLIMTAMVIPFVLFGAVHWLLIRLDGER